MYFWKELVKIGLPHSQSHFKSSFRMVASEAMLHYGSNKILVSLKASDFLQRK